MSKNIKIIALAFVIVMAIITLMGVLSNNGIMSTNKTVVAERVLVPGGQSIGIKMSVKGVLIVGLEEIETVRSIRNPGFEAGLQVGDKIISIDNEPVSCPQDVIDILNENEKKNVNITYDRNGIENKCNVHLAKSIDDGKYKIGLWVKERIAGIGTLTYYDPTDNTYGCLGHGILESQTGEMLPVKEGMLLETKVNSIQAGKKGMPGEIQGVFINETSPIGTISRNNSVGIFGNVSSNFSNLSLSNPMVVCKKDDVKLGFAEILTTIDKGGVKRYEIEITNINKIDQNGNRSIQYKVKDKELLKKCGGIIQGMSGSPIIQNERIVGAVTHVLIDKPDIGFGIFIETMLEQSK